MEQYLEDFKLHTNVPDEIIEKYRSQVPKEMLEFWRNYGFVTFMQGYLKSVNPDEFKEILVESSQRYQNSVVLFATGMGDLVIWSDGYVRLVNYRYGAVKTIMFTFEFFFQNINDPEFQDEDLSWQPYPNAIRTYSAPDYDQCFGYTPLLGLGGNEKVDNLSRVKLKEHILVITEFMEPVQ